MMGPFIYDWRNMLTKDGSESKLYKDIQQLMDSLSLDVVEVNTHDEKNETIMQLFLNKRGGEITTEDLEKAYNIVYPRYSVIFQNRDLTLEVTSPGLQRSLKDWHEFEIFKGKDVRVYSTKYSTYIVGKIESCNSDTLEISDYMIEDKKEKGDRIILDCDEIAKAKLEYRWEGRNA